MKTMVRIAAVAAAFAWSMSAASAQTFDVPPNSQIDVQYIAPKNTSPLYAIYTGLRDRKPLEELQVFLSPLKFPRKLKIQTDECGGATVRPYQAGGDITICYELVAQLQKLVNDNTKDNPDIRYPVLVGGFIQAVLHELSHAIFDMFHVPVWGREEDAADRLAAFIMTQFGEAVAMTTISATMLIFEWSNRTWTGSDFASVNSPEAQRFFNYVCIANGSPTVTELLPMPDFRQQQCTRGDNEYQSIRLAFFIVMMPHVDQELLLKIQAIDSMQWLVPGGSK